MAKAKSEALALLVLASVAGALPAKAATLKCGDPGIQSGLKKMAHDAFKLAALQMLGAKIEGDEKSDDIQIDNIYETGRTEFTRECSATLNVVSKSGVTAGPEFAYQAIQTEDGYIIFRWEDPVVAARAFIAQEVYKAALKQEQSHQPSLAAPEQAPRSNQATGQMNVPAIDGKRRCLFRIVRQTNENGGDPSVAVGSEFQATAKTYVQASHTALLVSGPNFFDEANVVPTSACTFIPIGPDSWEAK